MRLVPRAYRPHSQNSRTHHSSSIASNMQKEKQWWFQLVIFVIVIDILNTKFDRRDYLPATIVDVLLSVLFLREKLNGLRRRL